MTQNRPTSGSNDDYAYLSCKNASFYYGYKVTDMDEWCFEAKFDDKVIKIPFSKLGCDDQFDCQCNLMLGIGWILARYKLSL